MHLKRLLLSAALLVGLLVAAPTSALAYGGPTKVFEVTASANCNNPASPLCQPFPDGFGVGGAWGWFELDNTGLADGTFTFCAHGAPAGHINLSEIGRAHV